MDPGEKTVAERVCGSRTPRADRCRCPDELQKDAVAYASRAAGGSFLAHQYDLSTDGSPLQQFVRAARIAQRQPLRDHGLDGFLLKQGE